MAKYNLQPNEAVVLKADHVQRGDRLLSGSTDELILTNLHLIWVGRGVFGNVKGIEYFPLALVKVFDGRAQALLSKASNGSSQLEVFFQNGEETFRFQSGGKGEIKRWIDAINGVVTGAGAVVEGTSTGRALPGTAAVAETLKDTFSQFRGAFGGTSKTSSAPPPPNKSSSRCTGCGAPLSGIAGSVATCEYCDSDSLLP